MSDILRFGIAAEQSSSSDDFETSVGAQDNPCGKMLFDDPTKMFTTSNHRITSIPSPYARMHITDLAFREANTGRGILTAAEQKTKELSTDYRRAMSHCLDIYEMLMHASELNLTEKGITIHQVKLARTSDPDYAALLGGNKNLRSYIETLELFRKSYLGHIQKAGCAAYKFDFSILYIFKHNGRTFAATSPFTGFFAKADADLAGAGLVVNGHKLLTADPADYLDINHRSQKFREFMYLLLKDSGLDAVFANLNEAVKNSLDATLITALNSKKFKDEHPRFNFGNDPLPKIKTKKRNDVYIRPDGMDSSFLKYLLYLEDPVQFEISQAAYLKDIPNRVYPDGSDKTMQWLCINDLLADALVVLPYDINDNYEAIEYADIKKNTRYRRCLIPIKRRALDYLSFDDLLPNIEIKKYDDDHYAVTLKILLDTGGYATLRRDYYALADPRCTYPNGLLINGDWMKRFAFGIYPFVKSEKFDNIYKVLFYNAFDFKYELKFFYYDNNGEAQLIDKAKYIAENQTNSIKNVDFKTNCHYYQVHEPHTIGNDGNKHKIHIDFVELKMTVVKEAGNGQMEQTFEVTSIITPKLRQVANSAGNTTIAVDLGTSNTYIAYNHEGDMVGGKPAYRTITTMHDGWNELTLMNETCTHDEFPNALDENRDDLYLRQTDDKDVMPSDDCLPAQLCEFIPSRIVESGDTRTAGYRFPIPTVISDNRLNCGKGAKLPDGPVSLVHSCIPFAYYTLGKRKNSSTVYDRFSDGTFKWFYTFSQASGTYETNVEKQGHFYAFMEELLFIVRSHMLCKGYDLEQCRLIWTYPVSFDNMLVDEYKTAWEKMYCKYFNPDFVNAAGDIEPTITKGGVDVNFDELVISSNESSTPLFECNTDPAGLLNFTILMDIGGGSTDIIGYDHDNKTNTAKPIFLTSFNFAGNALYLDGGSNLNNDIQQNIFKHYMEKACRVELDKASPLKSMERINGKGEETVSSLMNFGFSQASASFSKLFKGTPDLQFMLKLHNAALIYHTAQLCHACSPEESPLEIYLSGNGSRLFDLNDSFGRMVQVIFDQVYGRECDVKIVKARNPKAATALGALKGYNRHALATNADAATNQKIMLGDDKTVYAGSQHNVAGENVKALRDSVQDNAKAFIDLFYKEFAGTNPPISKDEISKCLDRVQNDNRLNIRGGSVNNTLFFNHIALMMEQVSIKIWEKRGF